MIKNVSKIFIYFFLWGLLSFVSIKVKELVLSSLTKSANGEITNAVLSFCEVHNKGAAFNLFNGKSEFLILSASICIIIITMLVLAKSSKLNQNLISAMSLLSTGMTLNTLERIQFGYVTDYIYFTSFKNFPVFNIPDIMIVIGAFMLALSLLFYQWNSK